MVLPVAVLPAAVLSSVEPSVVVGLDVGTEPVVV
jgi:hypothetical protein